MTIYEINSLLDNLITLIQLDNPDANGVEHVNIKTFYDTVTSQSVQLAMRVALEKAHENPSATHSIEELLERLAEFQQWFCESYDSINEMLSSANESVVECGLMFRASTIVVENLWLYPIYHSYPQFKKQEVMPVEIDTEDKDPLHFGRPGERYIGVIPTITIPSEYSHLTKDIIFRRLKESILKIGPRRGARISRLYALLYCNGFLKQTPQYKSQQRELNVTCKHSAIQTLSRNCDIDTKCMTIKIESCLQEYFDYIVARDSENM